MSKYIKFEDAIGKIVNTPTRVITDDLTALVDREHEILDMLSDLPTIDIVRCEDCEYFKLHESVFGKGWICKRNHVVVGSVDFCSYGERREE